MGQVNAKLFYSECGSGMPALIIHGFGADHRSMKQSLEPALETSPVNLRRIYIDLPGMGQTKGNVSLATADLVVSAMIALIDELIGDERFLIIGMSYGAYLARGLLSKKSHQVAGMCFICPVTKILKSERVLPPKTKLCVDNELLAELSPKELEAFTALTVVQDRAQWEIFKRDIMPAIGILDLKFVARYRERGYLLSTHDALVEDFSHPALILTGRQDHGVGFEDAWNFSKKFPRATFATLDRAGHGLQTEQRELFEILVCEWLERVTENEEICEGQE